MSNCGLFHISDDNVNSSVNQGAVSSPHDHCPEIATTQSENLPGI